jgi:RHS repeat-associated protein
MSASCVTGRLDYRPFGELVPASTGTERQGVTDCGSATYGLAGGVAQEFTGMESDVETALDYLTARYYSPAQGRFTSQICRFGRKIP